MPFSMAFMSIPWDFIARRMLRAMLSPCIPGSLPSSPPSPLIPPMPCIICRMKRNFCTSSLTACSGVPEPLAIRATRVGSRTSAFGSPFSNRVIDWMIASMRTSSRSSRGIPAGIMPPMPGIFSTRSLSEPIFWMVRIWVRKSSSVNSPLSIRSASCSACFLSTTSSKSWINPTTSPRPRIRPTMPSARNGSSRSSVSPRPTKTIGAPVTSRMLSAAPPRASPSSLVSTTPVSPRRSWNARDVCTASWPIIASMTR